MMPAHIAAWSLRRDAVKASDEADARVGIELPSSDERDIEVYEDHGAEDERVFEFGGDSPPAPQRTDPMEEARATDWANQQQFEREQTRLTAEKAAQDEKDAAALTDWRNRRSTAYTNAQNQGRQRLQALGLDTSGDQYGLGAAYNSRIDQANTSLADLQDFSSAFSPGIFDEVAGGVRSGQRSKYATQFGNLVTPYYAEERFGSTADDAILASILGEQYDDAAAELLNARNRGQANSAVYNRALRDLGTAKTTANTELQNIGGTVLSDIIGDVNTRRQRALDSAAAWDFGSTYDPTAEAGRVTSFSDEQLAGLGGRLRSAIGDREFFDIPGLLGKATTKVGSTGGTTTGAGTDAGTEALNTTFQNQAQKEQEGSF